MQRKNEPQRNRTIAYTFEFAGGKTLHFTLQFDPATLGYVPKAQRDLPEWTVLEFCKCPHCPLDPAQHSHCPVAANLSELTTLFDGMKSHLEVTVTVQNSERKVEKHTSVQVGASSLIGLIMATSGCPILDRLRPMTATHLPFSTTEEVSFRLTTMYLLAQYFRHKSNQVPDWELKGLTSFLEEAQSVNEYLCKRLNASRSGDKSSRAADSDVLLNAVNILNTSGALAEVSIEEDGLDYWRRIYRAAGQI